jgi:hypothetical protein
VNEIRGKNLVTLSFEGKLSLLKPRVNVRYAKAFLPSLIICQGSIRPRKQKDDSHGSHDMSIHIKEEIVTFWTLLCVVDDCRLLLKFLSDKCG